MIARVRLVFILIDFFIGEMEWLVNMMRNTGMAGWEYNAKTRDAHRSRFMIEHLRTNGYEVVMDGDKVVGLLY